MTGAIDTMLLDQAGALEVLQVHGATACTDVTGFGLLGHLGEMLKASSAHALLQVGSVPALDGALSFFAKGIFSTLHSGNRAAAVGLTDTPLNSPELDLLLDPQTSGGLLAGIPQERADDCVVALHRAGYTSAVRIGNVCAGPVRRLTLEEAS